MRADGAEQAGIKEGEAERSVAAHGDAGNAAMAAVAKNAVVRLDVGQEFADEEILVADAGVARVDVKGAAGAGRDDQELGDFLLLVQILDHIQAAAGDELLGVAAQAVKEVEDGIAAGFVGIVGGRKNHAVGNGVAEDLAGGVATFGAALGGGEGSKRAEDK